MFVDRFLFLIIKLFFRKEVENMIVVYATLIIKGKRTFSQVPETIKEEVREYLIALDCEKLARDEP